jgi:hypothetical protein
MLSSFAPEFSSSLTQPILSYQPAQPASKTRGQAKLVTKVAPNVAKAPETAKASQRLRQPTADLVQPPPMGQYMDIEYCLIYCYFFPIVLPHIDKRYYIFSW